MTFEPPDSDRDRPAQPPAGPVFSDDGVDLTLLRWMLSLTPAERLQVLQQHVRSVTRLRDGGPAT